MGPALALNLWKPLAGLALFLLALSLIEETVRLLSGKRFKSLLINHTDTPLEGVFSGAIATAVLQSSSFVSLMMLAFVGAKLLPLKNAIAVVFGANLGTTATGWIVATVGFKFDLEGLALPLIAIGGLVTAMVVQKPTHHYGRLCLALGLLLLGMQYMKGSVDDVAQLIDLQHLGELSDWHFLLLGIVFSAIVQSSSATIVVALSALHSELIGLPAAVAMAIGADFGTTSTVVFGAIGRSAHKKRVALAHVVFNFVTDSLAFLLRVPLLAVLGFIEDPAITLVAFHTAMNVIGVSLFLPMIGRIAVWLESRFAQPDRRVCQFLDDVDFSVADAAVRAVEHESGRIRDLVMACNRRFLHIPEVRPDTGERRSQANADYLAIKELEGEILQYALRIDRSALSIGEQEQLESALTTTRSAVVALKTCKDASIDLQKIDDVDPALYRHIRRLQDSVYQVVVANEAHDGVLDMAEDAHTQVHDYLMQGISRGVIGELMASTALNVNRLLLHSNNALIRAWTHSDIAAG